MKVENNFQYFGGFFLKIYHLIKVQVLNTNSFAKYNEFNLLGNFKTSDYTTCSADFVTSSPNSTSGNSSFNTHDRIICRPDQTCFFYGHQHCWATPRYHPAVWWIRTSRICSCPSILCNTGKTFSRKHKFSFYLSDTALDLCLCLV